MASEKYLAYIYLIICTFLVFHNTLYCDFTFDDNTAVVLNRHAHSNETEWLSVFTVDYWGTPIQSDHSHKSYRPLTLLSFRLNHLISALDPFSYHLTNVILHLIISVICFQFLLNVLNYDIYPALFSSLLFAVHPLKSEAVSGIVGRAELLSAFFSLVSLFFYFNFSFLSFAICIVLATFSKEQSIMIPCVCLVVELSKTFFYYQTLKSMSKVEKIFKIIQHDSLLRIIYLTLFSIILVGLRFYIMGGTLPVFTKFDNPASFEDTPTRQLTYNYLLFLNAKLMLYPVLLCADWTMNSIPLVRDFNDPRNLCTLLFYVVLVSMAIAALYHLKSFQNGRLQLSFQKRINLLLGLSLTILPFIPASNLLFPVGFVIAERILYTPSIGYSLVLAIGLVKIRNCLRSKSAKFLLYLCAFSVIVSLAMKTYKRNLDWKNDLTLFKSGLQVNPHNAKLYNNIGHFYERQYNYEEALEYFKQAAEKDSNDIGSELNIARTLIHLNQTEEAEQLLWKIKPLVRNSGLKNRIIPHYLNIWINLARVISANESRLYEAERLYREVISIRRDFIDAYINLGGIYIRKGDFDEAVEIYELGIEHAEIKDDLKVADLYYNIGIAKILKYKNANNNSSLLYEQKLNNEIAKKFVYAIDINPEHKEALINLAILVQKNKFSKDNFTYYRKYILKALKAYSKDEDRHKIQFNIAMTLLDLGGPNNRLEAIEYFKSAVELKPDYHSALYNLALLYYDFKEFHMSLSYVNQILPYHPNYSKALLLLADIYSRMDQLDLTKKAYIKVLEIDSDNYEACHNLLLIYKKQSKNSEVKNCLTLLKNSSYSSL